MEKTRWVLIFSVLCLALVFSISPVEAQEVCNPEIVDPDRCDQDGDCFIKRTGRCRSLNSEAPIDCDDSDVALTANCGGGDGAPTLVPCPASPCIADVGKTFSDNTPAKLFANMATPPRNLY